jgi:hypothetical protein
MNSTLTDRLAAFPGGLFASGFEYLVDAYQRSTLFWDVLRQRGNNYLKHRGRGQPPVLAFDYEMVIDGRELQRPVNYALLQITPDPGAPTDPQKRPYVVVDPRAGHGPGIGGSKHESQVGVALRAGHPVYFVTFFPKPEPGQRLRDVAAAEAIFIEEVARRHPEAQGKPCVIGNCQAGWAVAGLAALRPEIMGPVILTGAPLSYWSGASGQNPMRYAGGLLGGKWMESMICDLGSGLFDGAHLVSNFENLDPANTLWEKYYNLYSKIDTEASRFLGFETWWGGYFLMNREEIDAIVSELFIGNKLARQGIVMPDGQTLNLRNIRSPVVVFASWGDNITPPQQALNWIEDVYGDEQGIIANDQAIVYLLHEDVGHLGIFVSGRVATKEHSELIGTLEMIDALPAGLYEMIIERKDAAAKRVDLEPSEYLVRFEARKMDDIRALGEARGEDEGHFQTVDAVSQINDRFYKTFVSPWVRAMASPRSAEVLRRLHPLRAQRECLSDMNPIVGPLAKLAESVRKNRRPVAADNPFVVMEKMTSAAIIAALDTYRDVRDTLSEGIFRIMYGSGGLGALFPPQARAAIRPDKLEGTASLLDSEFEAGGLLGAVLRIVAGAVINRGVFDRRSALIFQELRKRSRFKDVKPEEVRGLFKQQARLVRQDLDRAINSLAVMLPTMEERRIAIEAVRQILMLAPEDIRMDRPLVKRLSEVLEMDLRELPKAAAGARA